MKEIFALFIFVTTVFQSFSSEGDDLLKKIWLEYQFYPRITPEEQFTTGDSLLFRFQQSDGILVQKLNMNFENIDTIFFSADSFFIKNAIDEVKELNNRLLLKANSQSLYRSSFSSDLFLINEEKTVDTITLGKAFIAQPSPNKKMISYVEDNNIFIYDLKNKKTSQLTTDGEANKIINGYPDWVYEEEFVMEEAYHWNSTSEKIIYLQFDETEVPVYQLTDYNSQAYPQLSTYKYPKAGEKNSTVKIKLNVVNKNQNYTLYEPEAEEEYIPYLNWLNHDEIIFITLNRLQNHLKIKILNTENGETGTIYEEKSDTYVELPQIKLDANKNIFLTSEKDGYRHIYNLSPTREIKQITTGDYEVIEIASVSNNKIFYTSNKENLNGQFVHQISTNTLKDSLISPDYGTSDISFSEEMNYYYLTHSAWDKAPVKTLHNSYNNQLIKTVFQDSSLQARVKENTLVEKEFTNFTMPNGNTFPAWIMKPAKIKKKDKLPVLIYTYGGPGYQTVKNQYDPFNFFWYQQLVQKGYVIVSVDVRGSGGKGKAYRTQTYSELGMKESEDLAQVSDFLNTLPYVDKERIGIWGWSYGGYLSCLSITKEYKHFRTAIAVAPVTNWGFYDSIYTERYMKTPKDNEEGYNKSSPINYVNQLNGNLLLIHGMKDDNVHPQNSYELINALIAADKDFDVKIYPNRNHSIFGGNTRYHLFNTIEDYLLKNL